MTVAPASNDQQTVQFNDAHAGNMVDFAPLVDDTFCDGYNASADLGEFLSRPVRIFTTVWAEGSVLDVSFDPWERYFDSASIKKKTDNYSLLHCKLKLKIMINASPFYYGAAIVTYNPLFAFNPFNIPASTSDAQIIPLSQRPNIWIYPQDSQGGEMTLPFFYYKNWLDLTSNGEFRTMGKISIDSVGDLLNANSVSGEAVSIQVYAWAEDVKLAGPTTKLSQQSSTVSIKSKKSSKVSRSKGVNGAPPSLKKKTKGDTPAIKSGGNRLSRMNQGFKDEYGKGIVSTTASAVAAASGALTTVPIIGPFMTATSFVANAASSVANFFGWSNPPVVSDVQPFKDVPFHALASSEISTPIEKLSYDPKTELCVDSRTVGLDGTDELSMESFVTRESYIYNFSWPAASAADSLLFSSLVTPHMCDSNNEPSNATYGVPMAYLTRMFRFWHGDIIFRFRIIASQYHRGKFRISWDPKTNIDDVPDTESVTFTQTFDITEDNDIEIRIPWMSPTTWLKCDTDPYNTRNFGPRSPSWEEGSFNGCLNFRVLTKQTSPVASADIRVLVFVRGGDNLTFANPTAISPLLSHFPVPLRNQSGEVLLNPTITEDNVTVSAMADTKDEIESTYLVYMGEPIMSLRTCLRRTVLHRIFGFDTETVLVNLSTKIVQGRYPVDYGYDPNGIHYAVLSAGDNDVRRFNFVNHTPMTWLAPCFKGQRGAVSWRVNFNGNEFVNSMNIVRLPLKARSPGNAMDTYAAAVRTKWTQPAELFKEDTVQGNAGVHLTNQKTQSGCAASVPMYSRFRMTNTNPNTLVRGSAIDESNVDSMGIVVKMHPSTTNDANTNSIEIYTSAGIDYTMFFFLNVPPVYTYAAIPQPAQPPS
jgi:hypothetical protein